MAQCPRCGAPQPADARFCIQCAAPLAAPAPAQAAPQVQAVQPGPAPAVSAAIGTSPAPAPAPVGARAAAKKARRARARRRRFVRGLVITLAVVAALVAVFLALEHFYPGSFQALLGTLRPGG